MVQASSASHFWSAVADCLVYFHDFERDKAGERVTTVWRQMPRGPEPDRNEASFDDMIYHAEPWYIACNLSGRDLPVSENESRYREILHNNQLA